MKKRLLVIGLMIACMFHQTDGKSFLRTFKETVLDFNPISTFWHIEPYDELLDDTDTIKNKALKIGALSIERSLCPNVGTVAKGYAIDASARALGPDKEIIHYGPLVVDGQTLSYYMINFMYNVTFAKGDLGQRVAYTLYKMCIRKECARYVYAQVVRALSFLRVTHVLDHCLCGYIEKKPYRIVLADIAKRAVKMAIEVGIDDSFGRPYVFPLIYGARSST